MATIRITEHGWSSGTSVMLYDEIEKQWGRRFCADCRKMLRVGDYYVERHSPSCGRRDTDYYREHIDCEHPQEFPQRYLDNNPAKGYQPEGAI